MQDTNHNAFPSIPKKENIYLYFVKFAFIKLSIIILYIIHYPKIHFVVKK